MLIGEPVKINKTRFPFDEVTRPTSTKIKVEQLMRIPISFVAILIGLSALAQPNPERNWVYSEAAFADTDGNSLTVVNSLPKGGGTYTDTKGTRYSYVIFWYCITNESEVSLELDINFPAERHAIFPTSNSYIRLFLPPEAMTPEKIGMFDYGLSNLKSFLDTSFGESSRLVKTIPPKTASYFYISALIHQANGTARASFELEDDELSYHLKFDSNAVEIPCGQLIFKD